MPLSSLLKSTADNCPFCHQKAGIPSCEHSQCRRAFDAGWQEMINVAAEAGRTHTFNEKNLRLSLAAIAKRSYGDGNTVNQALEGGWKLGVGPLDQRQLLLPVPSIILAGSPPVPGYVFEPLRCGSWGRRIPG